jgi:hypothetical protein
MTLVWLKQSPSKAFRAYLSSSYLPDYSTSKNIQKSYLKEKKKENI